ncbi:hypothetical protein Ae168Ps1_6163c [Pseudonocardia sp. Ae168_Ps1]|nr:hypothetical protein Ae168Ps1_6163c [Pseudonocardia sp. Ae168_Ps1]OLL71535.1 hypothetical protein Ae263Ps1_6023c [Pseudonocardia sp. Ae263_Ps1]
MRTVRADAPADQTADEEHEDDVAPAAQQPLTATTTAEATSVTLTGLAKPHQPTSPSPPPSSGPEQVRPEAPDLAAPQVPLDTEMPSLWRRTSRSGTVARSNPARESFSRSVRSLEPISDPEAASFAGRFAADFQSFDEDVPSRRAEVLRPLLADPQACTWGWSGAGRQRADSPLPGRIYRPSDTVVFVEVIVRVTTYARACPQPEPAARPAAVQSALTGVVGPSCAPPDADPAWVAAEATWVRMTVPITRDDEGHLVVDPHLRPTDPSCPPPEVAADVLVEQHPRRSVLAGLRRSLGSSGHRARRRPGPCGQGPDHTGHRAERFPVSIGGRDGGPRR